MKKFIASYAGMTCFVGLICLIAIPIFSSTGAVFNYIEENDKGIDVKSVMQIGISAIMILSGLYIILSKKYEPDTINWAFATIGLVVGYWLPA